MIKINNDMITGMAEALVALREGKVEPMCLSITSSGGKMGWGWYKFKALPGHSKPGNAGSGWSHPEHKVQASAQKNWPEGGSFERGLFATLDEAKIFAAEVFAILGLDPNFEVECAWPNRETIDGAAELQSIDILRGGAENWAYYPDTAAETVDATEAKAVPLQARERESTDAYMQGQRIKKMRIDAGLTQQRLADAVNANIRYVQKMEVGEIQIEKVALATAIKLADALGVDVKELIK